MTTNYYIGQPFRNLPGGPTDMSNINVGTSSTAADYIELRFMTVNGATPTGLTARDIVQFCKNVVENVLNRDSTTFGLPAS
jgi:hypothetical protein